MRLVKLLLLGLLCCSLLVGAVTLTTDKNGYALGEKVVISGNCSVAGRVGLQANLGTFSLWVEEVVADIKGDYTDKFIPLKEGNYTLLAACYNGTSATKEICVGASCVGAVVIIPEGMNCVPNTKTCEGNAVKQCNSEGMNYSAPVSCASGETCTNGVCTKVEVPPETPPKTPSNDSGNFPKSGRRYYDECTSSIECGAWSYCNINLKQSRVCNDVNHCKASYTEEQACNKCEESWICSGWSECVSGEQVRACYDEHKCSTVLKKPTLRKFCQATYVPGPAPASVSPVVPTPNYYPASQPEPAYQPPVQKPVTKTPAVAVPAFSLSNFFNKYQVYFIGLGIFIVLIIIIIILIAHFAKPKQKVYNLEELKEWIGKERQMGTSDAQIRQILSENTGWNEEEISQAFGELRSE